MAQRKISVIIPCYNVSKYVDQCLQTLEKQTIGMDSLEIILINDASTDATLGKLLLWEMKYPENIMVIPLEQNVMQGAGRNIARQYCSGEYIAYLDADDWILPETLEKTYEAAKKYDADIVNYLSKKTFKGPDETDTDTESGIEDRFVEISDPDQRRGLFMDESCPLIRGCWDKLFKKSFVEENDLLFKEGVFDEESLFTIPAYMKMTRIYFLNEYLHRYFQNPMGSAHNLVADMKRRDDNAKTWMSVYDKLSEMGVLEENHELCEWFFVINYFIRSFVYAAQRHIAYDAQTVCAMQDTVRRLFPDYKQNKSLLRGGFYTEAMKFIDISVSEENIDSYNMVWRQIVETLGENL
ncbi:MAG: glycosyltransferase [Lachnospiraceae bacterium]|nr:glycosyltransferase [Lachnospiraceae bacterium]